MLDSIPERLGILSDAARFLAGEGALDGREALDDGDISTMYACVEDSVEAGEAVFSVHIKAGIDSLLHNGFASDGATHYSLHADTHNCFGVGGPSACFSVRQCIEPVIRSSGVDCDQNEFLFSIDSPQSVSTVIEQLMELKEQAAED